jgi:hypothetical protein
MNIKHDREHYDAPASTDESGRAAMVTSGDEFENYRANLIEVNAYTVGGGVSAGFQESVKKAVSASASAPTPGQF